MRQILVCSLMFVIASSIFFVVGKERQREEKGGAQATDSKQANDQVEVKTDRFSGVTTVKLKPQVILDKPDHQLTMEIETKLGEKKVSDLEREEVKAIASFESQIELGGGAYGLYQQYQSIQNRADGKQRALTEAFDTRIANQEGASRSLVQNQEMYLGEIVGANQRRAQGLTAAEIAGATQAAAGANRGAAVAKGGVNQGYQLDLQANWKNYDGAVKAAKQVRDASFEAARLRALSTVVSAVGHNVARDMEQGLALRY